MRLNMKEIASLLTDTLIHVGPGLFLLQETLRVNCGDSCLSITGSKEDIGFSARGRMLDVLHMQKAIDIFFRIELLLGLISTWTILPFIDICCTRLYCMWCLP